MPIRVGIEGLGKIALDEHAPVLRANPDFELVACASSSRSLDGVATFAGMAEMLDGCPEIDAVVICTPPQSHFVAARLAMEHKKHVLLEKPPCQTVAEFDELTALAERCGITFFQSWHARESLAVEQAMHWLAGRTVQSGKVVWKEDVRQWHPGQSWIWQEGGFGVLDAGINALSILTKILPVPLDVEGAALQVPENCASPIAATVSLRTAGGARIDAEFDFRSSSEQIHAIELETDAGPLRIAWPGSASSGDGVVIELGTEREEYVSLYRRFAALIARGVSDADKRPLELVTKILNTASSSTVAAFRD